MHYGRELRGGDLAIRSSNPFLRRNIVKNGDVGIDRDYDEDENGIKEDDDDDAMQICRILAIFFRRKMVIITMPIFMLRMKMRMMTKMMMVA